MFASGEQMSVAGRSRPLQGLDAPLARTWYIYAPFMYCEVHILYFYGSSDDTAYLAAAFCFFSALCFLLLLVLASVAKDNLLVYFSMDTASDLALTTGCVIRIYSPWFVKPSQLR